MTKPTMPPLASKLATVIKVIGPCVYFLLDGDEVVYVGSSRFGLKRIGWHVGRYRFDRIAVLEVQDDERLRTEYGYIAQLRPKHNRNGLGWSPSSKRWVVFAMSKTARQRLRETAARSKMSMAEYCRLVVLEAVRKGRVLRPERKEK